MISVTEEHVLTPEIAISRNDGFGNVRTARLVIMIKSWPIDAELGAILPVEQFDTWVANYVHHKDLARVMDFEPTARNLALYLRAVFRGMSSDVASVSVSMDGGTIITASSEEL